MLQELESKIEELIETAKKTFLGSPQDPGPVKQSLRKGFENICDYLSHYSGFKVKLTEESISKLYNAVESDKEKFTESYFSTNGNSHIRYRPKNIPKRIFERLNLKYGYALNRLIEKTFSGDGIVRSAFKPDMEEINNLSDLRKDHLMQLLVLHQDIDNELGIDPGSFNLATWKLPLYMTQTGPTLAFFESINAAYRRKERDKLINQHAFEFSGISPTYIIRFERMQE